MDKRPFVFFDIDDTILDFKATENFALCKAFSDLGIDYNKNILSRYSSLNQKFWEKLELGILSREQVLSGRFEALFSEFDIDFDCKTVNKKYESCLTESNFFMPGAIELLNKLDGNYRMFLVSNGSLKTQESRLFSAGISQYFDDIFISEDIGYEKPSKSFFEICFNKISDFNINRSIIIGDSLSSDILGGLNSGMLTCWYNYRKKEAREDIIPHFTIFSLDEIPELLMNLFCRSKL